MRAPSLSRRGFLQTSGSLVVTFSLGSLSTGFLPSLPTARSPSFRARSTWAPAFAPQ